MKFSEVTRVSREQAVEDALVMVRGLGPGARVTVGVIGLNRYECREYVVGDEKLIGVLYIVHADGVVECLDARGQ